MKIYTFKDKIESGKFKNQLVSDIIKNKKDVLYLIKEGYLFFDDVLEEAGIKKIQRDFEVKNVVVEHIKDETSYKKEKSNINDIMKSILTLNNDEEINDNNIKIDEYTTSIDTNE